MKVPRWFVDLCVPRNPALFFICNPLQAIIDLLFCVKVRVAVVVAFIIFLYQDPVFVKPKQANILHRIQLLVEQRIFDVQWNNWVRVRAEGGGEGRCRSKGKCDHVRAQGIFVLSHNTFLSLIPTPKSMLQLLSGCIRLGFQETNWGRCGKVAGLKRDEILRAATSSYSGRGSAERRYRNSAGLTRHRNFPLLCFAWWSALWIWWVPIETAAFQPVAVRRASRKKIRSFITDPN